MAKQKSAVRYVMPQHLQNPWRGKGFLPEAIHPIDHADDVAALLAQQAQRSLVSRSLSM